MKTLRIVILTLFAAVIACSDATDPKRTVVDQGIDPVQQTNDLDAARLRWRAQDLHTYAFTVQHSCFCGNVHPLYVFVLRDSVAGVLDLETGAQVDIRLGETVDGLFQFIQNANDHSAYLIRAQYDATKGFPTTIDYDGAAQVADDEIYFRVSDVHPVAPPT